MKDGVPRFAFERLSRNWPLHPTERVRKLYNDYNVGIFGRVLNLKLVNSHETRCVLAPLGIGPLDSAGIDQMYDIAYSANRLLVGELKAPATAEAKGLKLGKPNANGKRNLSLVFEEDDGTDHAIRREVLAEIGRVTGVDTSELGNIEAPREMIIGNMVSDDDALPAGVEEQLMDVGVVNLSPPVLTPKAPDMKYVLYNG